MRWTTLGAIMKAPDIIREELEKKNAQKADEFAQSLMGFFNGSNRLKKEQEEKQRKEIEEAQRKEHAQNNARTGSRNGWGSDGW